MGIRTSGVAWLEVSFLLFPHLALPFSGLRFRLASTSYWID